MVLAGLVLVLPLRGSAAEAQAEPEAPNGAGAVKLAPREALLLRNGDLLYGALESMGPEKGVRWRHPDAKETIQFMPDHVAEVHFPPRRAEPASGTNRCKLYFGNEDELDGSLVSLDSDKAVLQTWYGGEMTLPRKGLQLLVPIPPEGTTVFQGPTGLEGWTIGKVVSALGDAGEWKYRNGAFYATNAASIARDVNLPDVSRVEFDLAWKGLFQLAIAIYTDYLQPINLANKDTEPEFGGFYSLQLNSFSANLLPVKKNDPLRYLGQISVPIFNQRNTAHVEIRSSKAKRTVALLVDGQVIKQWVDNEEFAGQGTGIRLVHQGQGKVKLSNIRVSEWDGQFEEKATLNADRKQDLVKLRNGDKVGGRVESVQGGRVSVVSGNTRLEIPLARVKQIELAGEKGVSDVPERGEVRAIFNRGGAVTFRLEKWDDAEVLGSSPQLGKVHFNPKAFSRVELLIQPGMP